MHMPSSHENLAASDNSDDNESIDGSIEADSVDNSKKQADADPFDTHFQHPDELYLARSIEATPQKWRIHRHQIADDMTAIAAHPDLAQDFEFDFSVSKSPRDLMVGYLNRIFYVREGICLLYLS